MTGGQVAEPVGEPVAGAVDVHMDVGGSLLAPFEQPEVLAAHPDTGRLIPELDFRLVDDGTLRMDNALLETADGPHGPGRRPRAQGHIALLVNDVMRHIRLRQQRQLPQHGILGQLDTLGTGGHRLGERGLDLRVS